MNEQFWEFYSEHKGKIWGGLVGLVAALLILHYGFFPFLLICAFVAFGVIIGSKEENRARIIEFFNNLFTK